MENLKEILGDCRLNHVAIATKSLSQTKGFYESLGLNFSKNEEIVESQNVKTAFASIDEFAHLELLESTSEEGPIARFIEKKGEGLHHLCFEVKNLEGKIEELKLKGVRFLTDKSFIGANNCRVIFIHPKSAFGVLVELSESEKESL